MLRVYFLQQWYALADEALEDALYDSQAFARIELGAEGVPDAATLLNVPPPARNARPVQSPLHRDQRPTSPPAACCCAKRRWWTPRSSPRPPPPRTKNAHAIPTCTRPKG
jgi:hypothetical protein